MNATRYAPEATRQALVEAAAVQIHRHGYQAVSLEAILAATGVTKGALYHHFASKKALGLAVIDEVYRQALVADWRAALVGTDDPVVALIELLRSKRSTACPAALEHGCPVNNLAQEMAGVDEDFRLLLESVLAEWRAVIAEALERGRANGKVRPDADPQGVAVFLTASVEGAVGAAKNARDPELYRVAMHQLETYLQMQTPDP